MARPALLIGLGGTGQWVLTYVKKELIDFTKGEGIPPEVRLIAFDTTRQIDEKKKSKAQEEDPIVVNGVHLDTEEYYHIGGNIEKIVREIVEQDLHPHISSWLQAKTYLARLGAGQYSLEEGAGQMRPFGRMAVFKDLESNPENSKIFGTLRNAIQDIRRKVTENRNLEISIVASLAGGTGAGTAIDIAHIVRTIAEEAIGKNFVIRGFFVLPRAFHQISGGDGQNMRARAFAAIRELSRFITVFGNREYPMVYNQHSQFRDSLQKPVKNRLFDLCYLIDAQRSRNGLEDLYPKFGVFPSISDAILSFIDEQSGQEHTEHVNNIMPLLTRGDDIAYFSAIGTYAFTLPIREIAEENACKLALDFLEKLVKPEKDDTGKITALSAENNREKMGQRGSSLVEHFMKEPGSVEGMSGTLFLTQVADILEKGGIRKEKLLEQKAGLNNNEWLTFIEPEDTTTEIRELRSEVRSILEYPLGKDVKTSKELKEKAEFGHDRIEREVEQYLNKYLGTKKPDGGTIGGKFREGLDHYATLQINRFKLSLGNFCINLLNGSSDTDPEISKSGKLGFVQEFLTALSVKIELFCQFMMKVREIRQREKRLPFKREEVKQARNQAFEDRKKKSLFKDHADAAQKQFIQLMEEQVELEKDELIFDYVSRIAQQYKQHSIQLRDNLNHWVEVLAIGTHEQPCLYESLNKNLQSVKARRQKSNNFSRIRKEETDNEYEKELYKNFSEKELGNIFKSVNWQLAEEGNAINLKVLGESLMLKKSRERDRPGEHNVAIVLKRTRSIFQRQIQEEMISRRLMNKYTEDSLGEQLYQNGSPMVEFSSKPINSQPSNFLAVKHGKIDGDRPYFQNVVKEVSIHSGAKGQQAKLVQSEGAQKCTLIYTIDVINADSLSVYNELLSSYRDFTDDRRLLHNFPAEVNAVYYEQQICDKLQKSYRMFNPRLVFMLEHKDWVRQFTRCKVYDLVKLEKDDEGSQFWCLHLPKCEFKNKKYSVNHIELTPHVAKKADLLQAMDTFVFKRKDFRQGFEIPIQYDHLIKALILAENELGDEKANIDKINAVIGSGFIRDFSTSEESFDKDLGDLMHILLKDEIDRLSISE